MADLRELDAKVAERVMGFERFDSTLWVAPDGLECGIGPTALHEIPRYTTDPAAATEMLEKMRDMGYAIDISHRDEWTLNEEGGHWCAEFDGHLAFAETWMEAASRAALEAMGDG